MLAWLVRDEELATRTVDAALNHKVVAHFEILNGMAELVHVGAACPFPVVPVIQGKPEGGLALSDHIADFEDRTRVGTDATKGRQVGDDGIAAVHKFAIGPVDPMAAPEFRLVVGRTQLGVQRVYAYQTMSQ